VSQNITIVGNHNQGENAGRAAAPVIDSSIIDRATADRSDNLASERSGMPILRLLGVIGGAALIGLAATHWPPTKIDNIDANSQEPVSLVQTVQELDGSGKRDADTLVNEATSTAG